ncbi:exodeoxyribonuclease III [Bacteroidetes bacterium endosymbiont of Geopemphigus sp.]|uniref:exodeoxyribonuclease III n=1 Tax=Bacteroidetes bacterium endosymbiont of Geopemphigus sp. TaxID=2047937 RepID=UPI000CD1FCBC|nr:exodeoxyribonuclease III [Bacteroidetes bacterium endosymbiont of Geopemphigus sp.]
MKIISYNINGIRAAIKKGLLNWIEKAQPDVLCLQEIKANISQIETKAFEDLGYYHHWFPAQKKGYSGVAILSKESPLHVEYGAGMNYMDSEGRILRADFEYCSIISLYIPSGSNMEARLDFKLQFLKDFYNYIQKIKKNYPRLIICGDYNICHEAIDIHDPVRNAKNSGFLPVERKWISRFIELGFIDSFRHFISTPFHYSWWSYRANARDKNKGWRIDYQMVSEPIKEHMQRAFILPEARHSDHCPVGLHMKF